MMAIPYVLNLRAGILFHENIYNIYNSTSYLL